MLLIYLENDTLRRNHPVHDAKFVLPIRWLFTMQDCAYRLLRLESGSFSGLSFFPIFFTVSNTLLTLRTASGIWTEPKPRGCDSVSALIFSQYKDADGIAIAGAFASAQTPLPVRKVSTLDFFRNSRSLLPKWFFFYLKRRHVKFRTGGI